MSQLNSLIKEIENELIDNNFVLFLETLKDKEYGVYEKQNFLASQYDEILKSYEAMKARK